MGLGSYSVNMETPLGTPLAYAIENVRSWLDIRQIEPIDLKSQIAGHTIFLEVEFKTGDEVRIFERDFR